MQFYNSRALIRYITYFLFSFYSLVIGKSECQNLLGIDLVMGAALGRPYDIVGALLGFFAMSERRNTSRRRVLKVGMIAFRNGGGLSCMVRNISATGACLEVASPFGIPDDFNLVIESDRFQQPCHVVWRRDNRVGVAFDPVVPFNGQEEPVEAAHSHAPPSILNDRLDTAASGA